MIPSVQTDVNLWRRSHIAVVAVVLACLLTSFLAPKQLLAQTVPTDQAPTDGTDRPTVLQGILHTEVPGYAQIFVRGEAGMQVYAVDEGGANLWQYNHQIVSLDGYWRTEAEVPIFVAEAGTLPAATVEKLAAVNVLLAAEEAEATVASAALGGPNGTGRWGNVINLPLVAVAAANLPNNKLLLWSAYDRYTSGGDQGQTYTAIFDPATNQSTLSLVTATQHDMFCPGTSNLANGQILVNGGSSSAKTSIFNSANNSWTTADGMSIPRGYQGNTVLPSGAVMTIGGSWNDRLGNKGAELWTMPTGWSLLPNLPATPLLDGVSDPEGVYRADNHAWLWTAPNGKVFHAGPSANMHWLDTLGQGGYSGAGARGEDGYTMGGTTVMYDIGRILKFGGSPSYASDDTANPRTYVINIRTDNAQVTRVGDLNYARTHHNAVVLPTGEVLAIGGVPNASLFNDSNPRLTAELWSPTTQSWRTVAAMTVPRSYHSTAILLSDGRVFAGGGGLCGDCGANHPDAEIYSPPYLFNTDGSAAPRPQITGAPQKAAHDNTITVTTDRAVSTFALVRLSSVTHSTNNDQRRIPLTFTNPSPNSYRLHIPANPAVVLPGYYMLFAMNNNGAPSMAHTIQIADEQLTNSGPAAFELVMGHSDKCLDVAGGDSANGTNILQWGCYSQPWQRWQFVPANGGFLLKNLHTGKCLDLWGYSQENGANVFQWSCHGGDNQVLTWQGSSLKFKHSGQCLDIFGYSLDFGGNLVQWPCNGGANQRVALRSASLVPGSNPTAASSDATVTETLDSTETTEIGADTQRHQIFLPLIER